MNLDKELLFSDAEALAASGNSANLVDSVAAHVLGAGEEMYWFLQLAAKGGTTPTIKAVLVGADDSGFSSNKITIVDTGTLSDPALGFAWKGAVPHHTKKRYYRVEYTLGGTNPTFTATSGLATQAPAPITGGV